MQDYHAQAIVEAERELTIKFPRDMASVPAALSSLT
jgi:hypothetical protein